MGKVVVITGASSGFGANSARRLADAGHTVYAGMRDIAGRNQKAAAAATEYGKEHGVELRPIELDVGSQASADAAIAKLVAESGRLDVVIQNAGHMVLGPAEAFSAEEIDEIFDTNVLGTQRVNRAALPHLRRQGRGLVLWISSSSVKGGTPPYLGPYFAAKAAMDSLAVTYADELARWGVETTIIVPGSFTTGTNHFANAGHPADTVRASEYEQHYAGLSQQVADRLAALAPPDSDPTEVARAVVAAVDAPEGKRPYRVHIDPADDGSGVVSAVADHIRAEFLNRVGLGDLLRA
jgi:NAD(P)-dependent dehydrogenase (short-subunit alcohol dehydrogenase family)